MNNDYIFISSSVWNNSKLNMTEKFYLGIHDVTKDMNKTEQIMSNGNISESTILRTRNHLIKNGYLTIITKPEDAKIFTITHAHIGNKCEWCNKESYVLQEHHYPKLKSKGGTNVVHICPNCHYTYHAILKENNIEE